MVEKNMSRWRMLKKLVVFQVKLAFDAVRDLLLSPVSIVCTLIDIIKNDEQKNCRFDQLMNIGDKTDQWLNLFNHSTSNNKKKPNVARAVRLPLLNFEQQPTEKNVDQIFDKIEDIIRQQHKNGGVTASAKASIDSYLNKISQKYQAATDITERQPNDENTTNKNSSINDNF